MAIHVKIQALLIFGIFLIFGFAPPLQAYVMTGSRALEQMVQKLGPVYELEVTQQQIIYGKNFENGRMELNETVRYRFPDSFRSDINVRNRKRIHVSEKGRTITVVDGKAQSGSESRYFYYKDIFLIRSGLLVREMLARYGVDITVSSVGRFQDKIAFVVGATFPDESVSQFWVEKDTFKPIRWLIRERPDDGSAEAFEIRYHQWREVKDTWYPGRIEFIQGDDLLREIKVKDIIPDPDFKKDFFNIGLLRLMYPSTIPELTSSREPDSVDDIQNKIDELRKMIEQ